MIIIQDLGEYKNNQLYILREDLIPFSFGGNKARKAVLFFKDFDKGDYDCVVTYGSSSSNHCRVIANECCRRGVSCFIVSPREVSEQSFNSQMMALFGSEIITVPVNQVHETIEELIEELKNTGKHPYFIEGGGHGNIGTKAYFQCYQEIKTKEKECGVHFDYVFFASGTGTTQAGLICGQLLAKDQRTIVGISIARKNPRGRDVVLASVRSYLENQVDEASIQAATVFIDDYTSGYGKDDCRVTEIIKKILTFYGIPLDPVYTGKAFMGMTEYISQHELEGKTILFIHTGGTPLFFDELRKW